MSSQQVGQPSPALPRASPHEKERGLSILLLSRSLFFQTQDYDTWLQEFKEKTVGVLKQQMITTEPPVSDGCKVEGEGVLEGHMFLLFISLSFLSLSF